MIEPVNLEYLKVGTFRAIGHALTYSRVIVIFVLNISKNLFSCLQRDSVNMDQQVNTTEYQKETFCHPLTEEKYEH